MLKVEGIDVYYGELQALRGVSLRTGAGEQVAIIGANGAGKTTTLMTVSGLLHPRRGSIEFKGKDISRSSPAQIVEMGLVQIPEGRQIFPSLTVEENLEIGGQISRARSQRGRTIEWVFSLFPRLAERKRQQAGTLSGGEQQMLAIGRGLMARPELIMLDEPSLGLSPKLVTLIFGIIQEINRQGATVVLVEQNVFHALSLSNQGYVLENGEIVLSGPARDLLKDEHTRKAYLGM